MTQMLLLLPAAKYPSNGLLYCPQWPQVAQVPSVFSRMCAHAIVIVIRPRGNVLSSASHYTRLCLSQILLPGRICQGETVD